MKRAPSSVRPQFCWVQPRRAPACTAGVFGALAVALFAIAAAVRAEDPTFRELPGVTTPAQLSRILSNLPIPLHVPEGTNPDELVRAWQALEPLLPPNVPRPTPDEVRRWAEQMQTHEATSQAAQGADGRARGLNDRRTPRDGTDVGPLGERSFGTRPFPTDPNNFVPGSADSGGELRHDLRLRGTAPGTTSPDGSLPGNVPPGTLPPGASPLRREESARNAGVDKGGGSGSSSFRPLDTSRLNPSMLPGQLPGGRSHLNGSSQFDHTDPSRPAMPPDAQRQSSSSERPSSKREFDNQFNRIFMEAAKRAAEAQVSGDRAESPAAGSQLMKPLTEKLREYTAGRENQWQRQLRDFRRDQNRRGRSLPATSWRLPSRSAVPDTEVAGSGSFSWYLGLGALLVVLLLSWLLLRSRVPRVQQWMTGTSGSTFKLPPVRTRGELIRAVDRYLVWAYGRKSNWWDCRRVQQTLAGSQPEREADVAELTRCYQLARYSPDSWPISQTELERVGETLRQLSESQAVTAR